MKYFNHCTILLFQKVETPKDTNDVKVYSGMAYLNDQNIEKFISNGQHFIMFYAPWCKASQVRFWLLCYCYYSLSFLINGIS